MITVADILRDKGNQVWTVSPDATVADAVTLMAEKNIGAVLVLATDEKPVGIVSERDITRALLRKKSQLGSAPITDIMTSMVKGVPETVTVPDVMAIMTHNRFRHLPVNREGKLVGLISIGDVVKAEIHEQKIVIDQLEHYIAGSM